MDQTIAHLRTWQPRPGPNPLPEPFEAQALRVFAQQHPMAEYGNPLFKMERDAARAIVKKNALETAESLWAMPPAAEMNDPRWRDAFFATMLADVTAQLIYGQPIAALVPLVRADIKGYAESYTEDAVQRYASILNAVRQEVA